MHSSKKVIKASSIRIGRQEPYETSPESRKVLHGAETFPSSGLRKNKLSPADQLQRENEAKIAGIRQKAHEEGMAEGLKRGAAQQKQELAQLVSSLSGLLSELTNVRKEFLSRIENEVLDLSFAIAEKVLNREVAADKEVICTVLRGALSKIVDQEGMRIRVNPEDYRYLTEISREPFPGLEGIKNDMLEEDATIGRGGVVIVSVLGEVDARLDQQMNLLKDALAGD